MTNEKSVNRRKKVTGKANRPLAKVKEKKNFPSRGQNMLGLFMARESEKFLMTLP